MAKNKPHSYHHLTPQTYMNGWKHVKDKIYTVEKYGDNHAVRTSTKNIAGEDYFYSPKAGSLGLKEFEAKRIFKALEGYSIFINHKKVEKPLKLNKEFWNYHEWIIVDKEGNPIALETKKSLKQQILDVYLLDIEDKWTSKFEKQWNDLVKKLQEMVNIHKGKNTIKAVARKELITFMVSLEWRTLPLHPTLQQVFDGLTARIGINENLKSIRYPENERIYPFIETPYDEQIHGLLLEAYRQLMKGEGIIMHEANLMKNHLTTVLLVAPPNKEFITSDNPVCRFYNSEGQIEYIFPITPQLACKMMRGGPTDKHILKELTEECIVAINHRLKENCRKFYIQRDPDCSLYF